MMRINCAGLYRSGSTLQFNIIKYLIQLREPPGGIYASWISEYDIHDPRPTHVVKFHDLADYSDGFITFSCCRDIRAVAGSMIRMRWCEPTREQILAFCEKYISNYKFLRSKSVYMIEYNSMINDINKYIIDCSVLLNLHLNSEDILAIQERLSHLKPPGKMPVGSLDSVDAATQLHAGHIGDMTDLGARSYLPGNLDNELGETYHDYLYDILELYSSNDAAR